MRIIYTLILCAFIVGCQKVDKPAGIPDLLPTTITFTQDGSPLTKASVTLLALSPENAQWSAGGTTDDSGTLVVRTHAKYDGAVAGKYKIVVSKTEVVGGGAAVNSDLASAQQSAENKDQFFYLIEAPYRSGKTTPLEIEVAKGKSKHSFDVGKAVREPVSVGAAK